MGWLSVWREWVAWQRKLIVKIALGKPVKWIPSIAELFAIVNKALDMAGFPKRPQNIPPLPTPQPKPSPNPEPLKPNNENPYDGLTRDEP